MKTTNAPPENMKEPEKRAASPMDQIGDVVNKVETSLKSSKPDKRIRKLLKILYAYPFGTG